MSAQAEQEMVTIEVDGQELQAPKGSMIIEATDKAGIDIPRFCYHRKLSVAANCRMCLVDVEKAPKPLPACATPVADGMKVYTESRRALDAQQGVMEFLLVNHPLDCPICDQGGECELQDLAMGYGRSVSRFAERKRSVDDEDIGPLVSTEMTRCIHCTRCVRFLEEIAGTCELGGIGRGEHMEIKTFIGRNIDSELSGNVIDLCPVGALNNKPYSSSARAWEMSARPAVSSHDCVGSNIWYHVLRGTVKRAVPRDNEAINETWLADRDRFSHFGLDSDARIERPRIKRNGEWRACDWTDAFEYAVAGLRKVLEKDGAAALGLLASPQASSEELFLLKALADGLGCANLDHRLREVDTSDGAAGMPRSETPIAALDQADSVLLIGSNLRHEQPILGHKLRQAWRQRGARIGVINAVAYDWQFTPEREVVVSPAEWLQTLARLTRAATDAAGLKVNGPLGDYLDALTPADSDHELARALMEGERSAVVLGDQVGRHPHAAQLRRVAGLLVEATGGQLSILGAAANGVGAWRAGVVPGADGLDAAGMWQQPRKAYLLHGVEPDLDTANPTQARAALAEAEFVVAVSAFEQPGLLEQADVILPLAPVPEAPGSLHNIDGHEQRCEAAARPRGEARPGWKILRLLGEMMGLTTFDWRDLEAVQADMDVAPPANQPLQPDPSAFAAPENVASGYWRHGDVPMYSADALCRNSEPLQQTVHALDNDRVALHPEDAAELGLSEGDRARVAQGRAEAELSVQVLDRVARGTLWARSGLHATRGLGAACGPIEIRKV